VLGTLFVAMFGLHLVPCVIGAALLSLFYISRGGLRTVIFTDQVQFVLMYTGFIVMVCFLVARHGGLSFLHHSLPASTSPGTAAIRRRRSWSGTSSRSRAGRSRLLAARLRRARSRGGAEGRAVVGGVLDRLRLPDDHDRSLRARPPAAPRGSRAGVPHAREHHLPPVALGLFYLAMIATVMSTIDSYGFIAAETIGRDLVWRLRRETSEARLPFYTRIGLWVSAAFATLLALARPSVIGLWHDIGSVVTPALLLPVGTALLGRGRVAPGRTTAAMVVAFVATLICFLVKAFRHHTAWRPIRWESSPSLSGSVCHLPSMWWAGPTDHRPRRSARSEGHGE
jgi:SSS family solute:Na+ symporter